MAASVSVIQWIRGKPHTQRYCQRGLLSAAIIVVGVRYNRINKINNRHNNKLFLVKIIYFSLGCFSPNFHQQANIKICREKSFFHRVCSQKNFRLRIFLCCMIFLVALLFEVRLSVWESMIRRLEPREWMRVVKKQSKRYRKEKEIKTANFLNKFSHFFLCVDFRKFSNEIHQKSRPNTKLWRPANFLLTRSTR